MLSELQVGLFGAPLMLVLDSQGRILLWNRACSELSGYSFEDVRGKPCWDAVLAADEVADAQRAFEQMLAGDAPFRREFALLTRSGERRWVGWSHELTRRPNGEVEFVTAIGIDRTDARRAEDALRLSEARFSGIVSIAADAIVSIDDQQRIVIYNEGAERIFGWTRDEVIGKPLEMLIPERFRQSHREHLLRFAEEPSNARRMGDRRPTLVGQRKNGEEFSTSAAISKLRVGGVQLYTVVMRDISEQKLVERDQRFLSEVGAVLATTQDLDEMLGKIADLALVFLADCCLIELAVEEDPAHRRLEIVHADPGRADVVAALKRLYRESAEPRPFARALASEQPTLATNSSPERLASLAQSDEQLRLLRELEPSSYVGVPLMARGRAIGSMLFIRSAPSKSFPPEDVHICGELAYRAAHALESARLYRIAQEAVRARDQMLSIVAHDLRNPLNTAQLVTGQLLLSQEQSGAQPGIRHAAETLDRSLQRASRLIRDLLDVARLENGNFMIVTAPVAASELLRESTDELADLAANSGLELRVEDSGLLPCVLADKERALQVLSNLVGNAIKFTPRGGQIRLSVRPGGNEVCFSVVDDGPGISAADMPHLFDRFWQAQRRDRRGTGLGLPIAKGLVEAHGGRIWAESAPGVGSTFHFTLPVAGPGITRVAQHAEASGAYGEI
jgi:PAS domain S-box-containing protein